MVDDEMLRMGGRVAGLELVVKSLLMLQLGSQVKDEAGYAKAADLAAKIKARLERQVVLLMEASPADARETGVAGIMLGQMLATVRGCFEPSEEMMRLSAQISLDLSEPPTDTRN